MVSYMLWSSLRLAVATQSEGSYATKIKLVPLSMIFWQYLRDSLFDKRLDVLFWFWVSRRGSGSELRERGLLREVSFNGDSWVLFAVLSWNGDGLFWHMLGWRSKIAWTRFLPVSSLMGLVNIDPRRSITVLSERVVYSFWLVRLLSSVVHEWPDDVDVVDVLSTVTTLSWL